MAQLCSLTRRHRILDLGCGPGQLAIAFAPYAGSVVAIDPEPEMLRAASALASECASRIEFREASSEELGPAFGTFRMVVVGRAFHWMDRAETLRRLDDASSRSVADGDLVTGGCRIDRADRKTLANTFVSGQTLTSNAYWKVTRLEHTSWSARSRQCLCQSELIPTTGRRSLCGAPKP